MKEKTLWKGRPSHYINLESYATDIVLLLLGIVALVFTSNVVYVFCVVERLIVAESDCFASNVIYLSCVVLCFFIGPACSALYNFVRVKTWKIEVTDQRVIEEAGVFSKAIDEAELYRVKDIRLVQPFIDRLLGLSTIVMVSSDISDSLIMIPCINSKDAKILREELRTSVETRRNEKGIHEIDVN